MNDRSEPTDARSAIVVTFQHVPLKLFSAYGSELGQTPQFDRMATRGVLFDRHYADELSNHRSGHAWWDGANYVVREQAQSLLTLPEICRDAKLACHLISDMPPTVWDVAPQGWETHFLEGGAESSAENLQQLLETAESVLTELQQKQQRSLIWIHSREMSKTPVPSLEFLELYLNELPQLVDVEEEELNTNSSEDSKQPSDEDDAVSLTEDERTTAWQLIEETLTLLSSEHDELEPIHLRTLNVLAAANLSECDHVMGSFYDRRIADIESGQLMLLLTADRGQSLLESKITKQLEQHQQPGPLQEETMHLPLLMVHGNQPLGRRSNAFTHPADIPATLLDWFHVSHKFPTGQSLFPLLDQPTAQHHPHLICRSGDWESIRNREWLLIRNRKAGIEKLYSLPEDRWQVLDILSQNIEQADRLIALLNQAERV